MWLRLLDIFQIAFYASSSETLKIIYEMIKVVLVSSYFVFLALIWASSWLFIIGSLLQYVVQLFRKSHYSNRPVMYRPLTRRPPSKQDKKVLPPSKGDETAT